MKKVSVKYNIFLCVIFMTGFWGCGVKGNPVIIKNVSGKPQAVRNLKSSAVDHAVSSKGDIETDVSENNYVAVEKNKWGTGGNESKDCPKACERIGPISLHDG